MKMKNPYIFKVNGKLVRIRFSDTNKTADDFLTSVLKIYIDNFEVINNVDQNRKYSYDKEKNPFEIKLNSEQEIKVQENWNSFIKGKNRYWDGELISVTKFDLDNNIIEIGKTKFSCLIYSKNNNDLDVRSLFVSVLFKTLDNKYVVIKITMIKLILLVA